MRFTELDPVSDRNKMINYGLEGNIKNISSFPFVIYVLACTYSKVNHHLFSDRLGWCAAKNWERFAARSQGNERCKRTP